MSKVCLRIIALNPYNWRLVWASCIEGIMNPYVHFSAIWSLVSNLWRIFYESFGCASANLDLGTPHLDSTFRIQRNFLKYWTADADHQPSRPFKWLSYLVKDFISSETLLFLSSTTDMANGTWYGRDVNDFADKILKLRNSRVEAGLFAFLTPT